MLLNMEIFRDEPEFTDIHMMQRVLDMFERRPHIQRIVRFGLLGMEYTDELDYPGEDDHDNWAHGYSRFSNENSGRKLGGNLPSGDLPPLRYYPSAQDPSRPGSVKAPAKESDAERKARLLQESKKSQEKAEKKRLKKQKQKQRKHLEKLEKEKQNPAKTEEEKDAQQQCKAEGGKPVNDQCKDNSSVKLSASAKDSDSSDSSEHESSDEDDDTKNDSGDSEELDMTSTFVSKAALIAKRKMEQKPRQERKERKKIPVKEERRPDKPNEDQEAEKKGSAAPASPTFEDNVKISTDLAIIGNKFASTGDFNTAVKYFTDAIKYNPTEFKLFGNRSFCFEKLQEYDKALMDAELSLGICPGWVKGLFRKGRALAGLKRYDEAAQAFSDVLKLDTSCADAAQELMRVQITQLMEYGFTREQSSNALIIHGTVKKALEVLSKLNCRPGAIQSSPLPPVQVANVTGVSPVLSASTHPGPAAAAVAARPHPPPPPQSRDAPKKTLTNKPLGPVQNMSNVQGQSRSFHNQSMKTNSGNNQRPLELFPVWVGNLNYPVNESTITNLFNKVGVVYSVKLLIARRCAFVNFTKQECCGEAIQRFHGYELNGIKLAVRYPDKIPPGMGISKSALRSDDLQDENVRQNEYVDGRSAVGSQRPARPYKPVPDHRGNY